MLALALTLPLCGVAVAQDAAPGAEPGAAAADVAVDAKVATGGSAPAVDPAAAQALQAIVMDVQGKARWRAGPDAEWHEAKVNDLLDPGAEVRTGLRSRVTMRVGRNATVLVDSGTSFSLSELVAEGQTLRTTAAVKTGRVDFKVDKVGFANDFKVVTPQTTLSVRGTGFSLATGALNGFEISGARTNAMNAIELRYAVDNARFFLSGNAQSTSQRQEPAQNAWLNTVGPPPIVGLLANNQQLVQQVAQGTAGNAPTNPQQFQQQNAAESNGAAGAGALMQAADDPNASDELLQLARARVVSGYVPGDDSSGGETDPLLRQLSDPFLRDELRSARSEVPSLTAGLAQMDSDSAALQGLSNALAAFYPEDGDGESLVRGTFDGIEPSPEALQYLNRVIALGTDLASQPEYAAITSYIQSTEAAVGVPIFTDSPSHGGSGGGTSPQLLPSVTPMPGIEAALQNAGMWASRDGFESSFYKAMINRVTGPEASVAPEDAVSMLRELDTLAQRWTIDATVRGSDGRLARSPVLLTLSLNEVVQEAWDQSVRSMPTWPVRLAIPTVP